MVCIDSGALYGIGHEREAVSATCAECKPEIVGSMNLESGVFNSYPTSRIVLCPLHAQVEALVKALHILGMLGLLSARYSLDGEFQVAVDKALAAVRATGFEEGV
jgi:hypothetical protein